MSRRTPPGREGSRSSSTYLRTVSISLSTCSPKKYAEMGGVTQDHATHGDRAGTEPNSVQLRTGGLSIFFIIIGSIQTLLPEVATGRCANRMWT